MFKWMMIKRAGRRLAVMRFSYLVRSTARFRESTPVSKSVAAWVAALVEPMDSLESWSAS